MVTGEASRDPEPQPDTPAVEARPQGGVNGGTARAKKLAGRHGTPESQSTETLPRSPLRFTRPADSA